MCLLRTTASSKFASKFSAETKVVLSASSIAWWIAVWYSGRKQPQRKTRPPSGTRGSTPCATAYLQWRHNHDNTHETSTANNDQKQVKLIAAHIEAVRSSN